MAKAVKHEVSDENEVAREIENESVKEGVIVQLPATNKMTISEKALTLANGKTFVLKRRVTMPILSWKEVGKPITFKSIGKYEFSTEKKTKSGTVLPATPIMPVINLDNGQEARLIIGAIMLDLFEQEYKNDAYIGKSFALLNHGKQDGKRFNDIELIEIE